MSRIYIAGPVTGIDRSEAALAFSAAKMRITLNGDEPVCPLELCSDTMSWRECMVRCIKALLDCDGIYMLNGWKRSRGAKLEHFIALKLGMDIKVER